VVEGLPDNRPTVLIAPALPVFYFPDLGLFIVKTVPKSAGEELSDPNGYHSLPILVPLLDIERPSSQYFFPEPDNQKRFLLGSDDSLIELPPLRRLLAEVYHDEERRKGICQQVELAMETAYKAADSKITLSAPVVRPVEVVFPDRSTQTFNTEPLRTFSCEIDEYGGFRLRAGDVGMIPNFDSHAVSIPVRKTIITPLGPKVVCNDIRTDASFPLAYLHTPVIGGTMAVNILKAGAGALALAV
jgi:hypothetical protein